MALKNNETIPLEYPIESKHQGTVSQVTMRRPKFIDIQNMNDVDGGEDRKTAFIIGCLSGLSQEDVHQLDYADASTLGHMVVDFLG